MRLLGSRTLPALLAAALVALMPAVSSAQTKSTLQKVIEAGVLKVGVVGGFPPWQYTTADGKRAGYETDLARLLAEQMGVDIEFVETNGAGRIPNLLAEKVDVVIGALNYSAERAKVVAFTRPYANPVAQIVVRSDSKYRTIEDLNSPDVTLGLTVGGIEADILPKLLPNAKFITLTSTADVHQAFLSGRVTTTFNETGSLDAEFLKQSPGSFRLIEPPFVRYSTRMAIRYGDPDWLTFLNTWIESVIYSGDLERLWKANMGGEEKPLLQ